MHWSDRDFEALFRAWYPRVLRSAQLLLGDRAAAEDVTQEAFARLLGKVTASRQSRPAACGTPDR
jgi:DNA-directed RNA polymerase specialized sigma24 family protein